MAGLVTNSGLTVIGQIASNTNGPPTVITSMSWDDSATAFAAGNTTLGSPTTVYAQAFDATPTRLSQTVTHISTADTTHANMTVRRVALHNLAAGSVTGSSASLICGVDGQFLVKNSNYLVQTEVSVVYSSNTSVNMLPNQGLQVVAGRASNTADAFAAIQSMSGDDSSTALVAGTTTLGSPTNLAKANFSTVSTSGQTIQHIATLTAPGFTIKRVILHNAASASVTGTSTTVIGGQDSLSLLGGSMFDMKLQMDYLYQSV